MSAIRQAVDDDIEDVAELEIDVFGAAAWSWDSVVGEFEGMGTTRYVVVANEGDRLIGYASLMYVAGLADLQRIAVRAAHRRAGVAGALLTAVLDAAMHHGCHKTLLEVAADNEPALAFYRRHGFREIARRKRYYGGQVDGVVMERPLEPGC